MSATTKIRVEEHAKADAVLFVEEFGEVIDPAATDWDATAWGDVRRELKLSDQEAEGLWEVYQTALVAETQRLVAAGA